MRAKQTFEVGHTGESADNGSGVGTLARLRDSTGVLEHYARAGISDNTHRAYRSDLSDFIVWCETNGCEPLPASPEVALRYLESLADNGRSWSTIQRRIAAIAKVHRAADLPPPSEDPRFREAIKGLKRLVGAAPRDRKKALLFHDLVGMVRQCPQSYTGRRDAAILLVGWACGLRRSEIVELDVEDITWEDQGIGLTIKRSKTDQAGVGTVVPLFWGRDTELCPVTALEVWLDLSKVETGPIFRSVRHDTVGVNRLTPRTINRIVKQAAARTGIDPQKIGAHSLRSGFATSAARGGANLPDIMRVTRHASYKGIKPYIEAGRLFEANPAAKAGL
jgi:site-specific recombinase XerD